MKSLVAIIGRPNVGKSTLFNRLLGGSRAVVADQPGTTRDRIYGDGEWQGIPFTLIDTGGLVTWGKDPLLQEVRKQVKLAVAEAEAILFVVDSRQGMLADDDEAAGMLRRAGKPVLLAVNKLEGKKGQLGMSEFYALGFGEPYPISALHGSGVAELLDHLVKYLKPVSEPEVEGTRLAIVGQPNVGKSTLVNRLLGGERAIVHPQPGTTRDALDTPLVWQGQRVTLIDTAGIKRRGKIQRGVEEYSVLRALKAISRAEVVLLLLDAVNGVSAQDTHIAGYILEARKGLVLLVNKWDLVPEAERAVAEYTASVRHAFHFAPYAPLLFVSALRGEGVSQLLPMALQVQKEANKNIPQIELNLLLEEAIARHPPPSKAGKKLRLYSVRQTGIQPPSFLLEVNDRRLVHFSYQRYLENRLREAFGFVGTPIHLEFANRQRKRIASHSRG